MSNNVQDQMIGKHPNSNSIFSKWLEKEDKECTERKKHRSLTENNEIREEAISQISEWLAVHHIPECKLKMLERKKAILNKYNYKKYASELQVYPASDRTRKGNLAEIVLIEYLQETSKNKNLVYKLRFNPNIDQAMKGDDVLLIDEDNLNNIIVGESKFRTLPNKDVIKEISKEYGKQLTLPLSLTFVADRLFEEGKEDIAYEIYELNENLHKGQTSIINVGFLFSNLRSSATVEKHMDSDNKNFIMISLGVDNPQEIIDKSYNKAIDNIKGE